MSSEHDEQSKSAIVELEFRLAMTELAKYLASAIGLIHNWRHDIAEKVGIGLEQPLYLCELRLEHWARHHADNNTPHEMAQLLAFVEQQQQRYRDDN